MDPLVGSALISGGGGLISNLFNLGQAKKQREHQMKLSEYQYTKDVDMWKMANEYNSPGKQMERLKAAGLNPNLVYGGGNVSGNVVGQTPKYQAPGVEYGKLNLQLPNLLSLMGMYQDVQARKAQNDYTREQIIGKQLENKYLEDYLKGRNTGQGLKNQYSDIINRYLPGKEEFGLRNSLLNVIGKSQLYGAEFQTGNAPESPFYDYDNKTSPYLRQINSSVKLREQESDLKDLEINLRKMGIGQNDSVIIRMLIQSGFLEKALQKINKWLE